MKSQRQRTPYFIAMAVFIILLCGAIYEKDMIVSSFPSSSLHNLKNLTEHGESKSDLNADKFYEYDDDGIEIEDDDELLSTESLNRTDDYTPAIYSVIDWKAFKTFYGSIAGGIVAIGIGAVALYYAIRGCCGCQRGYSPAHSDDHDQSAASAPVDDMDPNDIESFPGFKIRNQTIYSSGIQSDDLKNKSVA